MFFSAAYMTCVIFNGDFKLVRFLLLPVFGSWGKKERVCLFVVVGFGFFLGGREDDLYWV